MRFPWKQYSNREGTAFPSISVYISLKLAVDVPIYIYIQTDIQKKALFLCKKILNNENFIPL